VLTAGITLFSHKVMIEILGVNTQTYDPYPAASFYNIYVSNLTWKDRWSPGISVNEEAAYEDRYGRSGSYSYYDGRTFYATGSKTKYYYFEDRKTTVVNIPSYIQASRTTTAVISDWTTTGANESPTLTFKTRQTSATTSYYTTSTKTYLESTFVSGLTVTIPSYVEVAHDVSYYAHPGEVLLLVSAEDWTPITDCTNTATSFHLPVNFVTTTAGTNESAGYWGPIPDGYPEPYPVSTKTFTYVSTEGYPAPEYQRITYFSVPFEPFSTITKEIIDGRIPMTTAPSPYGDYIIQSWNSDNVSLSNNSETGYDYAYNYSTYSVTDDIFYSDAYVTSSRGITDYGDLGSVRVRVRQLSSEVLANKPTFLDAGVYGKWVTKPASSWSVGDQSTGVVWYSANALVTIPDYPYADVVGRCVRMSIPKEIITTITKVTANGGNWATISPEQYTTLRLTINGDGNGLSAWSWKYGTSISTSSGSMEFVSMESAITFNKDAGYTLGGVPSVNRSFTSFVLPCAYIGTAGDSNGTSTFSESKESGFSCGTSSFDGKISIFEPIPMVRGTFVSTIPYVANY